MRRQTCRAIRRRLAAFHDGELSIMEQRALRSHLEACAACTDELAWMEAVGHALRGTGPGAADPSADLALHVVTRARAEREQSWRVRLGRVSQQRHLLWGGLGAAVGLCLCLALVSTLAYVVKPVRADSLAGVLAALASPGSNENPFRPDGRILLPRFVLEGPLAVAFASPVLTEEDVVFTLAAVITREGRVVDPALLFDSRHQEAAGNVLEFASAARFEPARFAGSPVAVNMVWLVARTTVRGRLHG